TTRQEAIAALLALPASTLNELGRAMSHGTLRHGHSRQSLLPFVGDRALATDQALRLLADLGFTNTSSGVLCEALGSALSERDTAERSIQLVLSGPELAGTPVMDTRTTVLSLFEEAAEEALITSFVFHDAAEFFSVLAEKADANPEFRVTFVVDLTHRRDAPSQPQALIAQSFAADFRKKHWPGRRLPEIWHDPRQFESAESGGGVLHAKTVVIDRKVAFITSANFTGAAHNRNIEAGVLLRQPRIAARLHGYFVGLIGTGVLRRVKS
ncbi:MAG: DISARM system phospholipase D-like protein DrmC, partial [Limisphaerales bacterium]